MNVFSGVAGRRQLHVYAFEWMNTQYGRLARKFSSSLLYILLIYGAYVRNMAFVDQSTFTPKETVMKQSREGTQGPSQPRRDPQSPNPTSPEREKRKNREPAGTGAGRTPEGRGRTERS